MRHVELLPISLLVVKGQHIGKALVGIRAGDELILVHIAKDMDGSAEIGEFQLDAEGVQTCRPNPVGKGEKLFRDFDIILDTDQCGFPYVLDTLAAAASDLEISEYFLAIYPQ